MSSLERFPKVSVLMTTYQQREYVAEAVDSVLLQDYPNWELIIGDDGSTDGTQDVLNSYQKKYKNRVKLIPAKSHAGITANCNRVFRECSGDFIAFQAGDDIWLPGKMTAQVAYMQDHPECSICYHNLEAFDNDTGATIGNFNNAQNPPRAGKIDTLIRYGCFNGAIANLVRRSKCPSYGFDERIPIASDWLFWIEALMDNGEIHYIDRVFGRYRIRRDSASNRKTEHILDNFVDHLNSLNILLIKKPVYYRDIFFRMFEIYSTLSIVSPSNSSIYKSIYYSRRLFFLANTLARLNPFGKSKP